MKSIYILLTKPDTYVSKVIGLTTADKYTHASISFEKNLIPMYSFSRKSQNRPLPAGLRIESVHTGFCGKQARIPCALYELKVDDETFARAKEEVDRMMDDSEAYRFSVIGLFACKMHIQLDRKYRCFCSQFISRILTDSEAMALPKPPSLMRPSDYADLPGLSCIYTGKLSSMLSDFFAAPAASGMK